MRSFIPAVIARRYIFAGKSRNGVGVITTVSICGVAAACAAIICVLSVFNGFKDLMSETSSALSPDVIVTPAKGKIIADPDSVVRVGNSIGIPVETVTPTLTEKALALSDGYEMSVTLKGVDPVKYRLLTGIEKLMYPGSRYELNIERNLSENDEFSEEALLDDDPESDSCPGLLVSVGAANRLRLVPGQSEVTLFTPVRTGNVNLANPAASFHTQNTVVSGVFRTKRGEFDKDLVITDIEAVRSLLEYPGREASAIEISLLNSADNSRFAEALSERLGPAYIVLDRERQHEASFRMVNIEKWITFLLLGFILVIAFFNVISSLSMLVIDKQRDMEVLRFLGMTKRAVASVFRWESMFVSLAGGLSGIVIGVMLCLLQIKFGLVKLNGSEETLIVTSYPVSLELSDVLAVFALVLLTGGVVAFMTGRFARRRCNIGR